jgi:hypothetical protein
MRLIARARTRATPDQLVALLVDPSAWVSIEPRVTAARWNLPGPPRAGAVMRVRGLLRYRVPGAAKAFGQPEGELRLITWEPPATAVVVFQSTRAHGDATVALRTDGDRTEVHVNGWVRPNTRLAALALTPLESVLERRATRSIVRAIARLDAAGDAQRKRRPD